MRRLDVFASAVGDTFAPEVSDVDVLVEAATEPGSGYFNAYFDLSEGWRESPVDRSIW